MDGGRGQEILQLLSLATGHTQAVVLHWFCVTPCQNKPFELLLAKEGGRRAGSDEQCDCSSVGPTHYNKGGSLKPTKTARN